MDFPVVGKLLSRRLPVNLLLPVVRHTHRIRLERRWRLTARCTSCVQPVGTTALTQRSSV